MRDWPGAGIHFGLTVGGVICLVNGLETKTEVSYSGLYRYETTTTKINALGYVGYVAVLGGVVFNIARVSTYKKPPPKNHALGQYGDLNLAVFPDHQGNVNAGVVYNLEF